jgi:hypothetical protein
VAPALLAEQTEELCEERPCACPPQCEVLFRADQLTSLDLVLDDVDVAEDRERRLGDWRGLAGVEEFPPYVGETARARAPRGEGDLVVAVYASTRSVPAEPPSTRAGVSPLRLLLKT